MDRFPPADRCLECPARLICRCLQVTEATLLEALTTQDIRTLRDIRRHTGAGDGCTACHAHLQQYLEAHGYSDFSSALPICSAK
jgi:NAD(P)H-nitrite reductase large subunit